MVFIWRGSTSGGQQLGSVFSVAVYEIQASKCYIKSLPLVLKDIKAQGERSAVQLPLDHVFAFRR